MLGCLNARLLAKLKRKYGPTLPGKSQLRTRSPWQSTFVTLSLRRLLDMVINAVEGLLLT